MLLVKTYIDKSAIHGIGLFAGQAIRKGVVVYKLSPGLDISLSKNEMNRLDSNSRELIKYHGYLEKNNKWHLAFDNIRFCNHNKNGNITVDKSNKKYQLIAKRDIEKNEELTQNYKEYEQPSRIPK